MKRVVLLLLLLFSPAFALQAAWTQLDVNGDGSAEHLIVSNLADIAFNEKGQIVGWYVKMYKGMSFKGRYERAPNLVKAGLPLPGTVVGFTPTRSEFDRDGLFYTATFSDGTTTVRYRIDPRRYTLEFEYESPHPATLLLTGINHTNQPVTKILLAGSDKPLPAGSGQAVYAAIQSKANKGYAFVIRAAKPFDAKLEPGAGGATISVSLPAGKYGLGIYGGLNELVRLHVEGLLDQPGLFQANIWGKLSLGLLYLMELAYKYTHNWGLAILLLTIFVRLLLWPLMQQQFKSMAEMNKIKPLMDEINKKYKDDPEKKNEAVMNLYREHNINPASGCLPMLIQLPILFMMWRVIANYEFDQGFLWLPDLSLPDPYYILPVLYVLVMLAQTMLMSRGNKDALRQGVMMNLIFIFLVLKFPAGVTLYWVFSTFIGLFQQWSINKQLGNTAGAQG